MTWHAAIMSFVSIVLYADCEMMAMIAKRGNYISWLDSETGTYNDPYDYFQFMRSHSGQYSQNDGYGVIYYPDDGTMYFDETNYYNENNQAWYKTNRDFYGDWHLDYTWYGDNEHHWKWNYYEPLGLNNIIEATIMDNNIRASIVLGHDRNTTGYTYGNHPFRLDYIDPVIQDTTYYTFKHNGNVVSLKLAFYDGTELLQSDWFSNNPSNWEGEVVVNPQTNEDLDSWIDSELYFHYIVANIEAAGGDIIQGIHDALSDVNIINDYYSANFILSDGFTVYAYRRTNQSGDIYNLEYYEEDGFSSIKTQEDDGTPLSPNDLAIISPYGDIEIINLVDPLEFKSGIIAQSTTWNSNILITDDIIIPVGVTLNIDAEANFVTHSTFTVNGTVNLQDDSEFNINHSSEVLVENNGFLFLNWGSTITGSSPTTYGATPPGQPAGGEEVIPGDRIIAQNGGIITTGDDQNPGDLITIGSGLPESEEQLWDGIFIQNPDNDIDYWFVNCDISWINKLSIEMTNESQNIANLKLYLTDFQDAGQIIARHGHNLSISGEDSENRCNIRYNHETPIVAYDSPVYIDWALIEDNGRDINGGLLNSSCDGVHLNYSADLGSEILNTIIQGNTGCGIETYSQDVNIDNCTIELNEKHGLLTKEGTFLVLENNTILNNLYAEYVSVQESYNWAGEDNTIEDLDGNAGGNDRYILMAYQWDGIECSIDVRGNEINHENNEHRFFPIYAAFRFDTGEITPEREMLYSALDEMKNENYTAAETMFQQIISVYPNTNEAATSIRGLLFIENYTDKDYAALRSYIDNIQVSEDTSLYKAKEDVRTKSFMKDKDYLTVIDRLETVINNSQIPDEVIMAMIDEGYCYMELAEGGERGLPVNCTVKTTTFDDYQAKVRELESQFSFYLEEDDQNTTPIAGNILSLTNFPNPFNPTTTISFDLASESNVSIIVYNVKGQKVKQLINEQLSIGQHSIEWNGKNSNNKSIASGIYFYKISAGKSTSMKKMLLLK